MTGGHAVTSEDITHWFDVPACTCPNCTASQQYENRCETTGSDTTTRDETRWGKTAEERDGDVLALRGCGVRDAPPLPSRDAP